MKELFRFLWRNHPRALAALVGTCLAMAALGTNTVRGLGVAGPTAGLAGLGMALLFGATVVPLLPAIVGATYPSAAVLRGVVAMQAALIAVSGTILAMAVPGLDGGSAVAVVVAVTAGLCLRRYREIRARTCVMVSGSANVTADPAEARALEARCRAVLADPATLPTAEVHATVNLARALVVQAGRSDGPDRLIEATRLLEDIVRRAQGDPLTVYFAANALCGAALLRRVQHRDETTWLTALELKRLATERLPDRRYAAAASLLDQAMEERARSDAAAASGSAEAAVAEAHRARAVALCLEAIDASRPADNVRVDSESFVANLLATGDPPPAAALDEAVLWARRALASSRAQRQASRLVSSRPLWEAEAQAAVHLATFLHQRAGGDGAPDPDVDSAEAIALAWGAHATRHVPLDAPFVLAITLGLRDDLGLAPPRPGPGRPPIPSIPVAFRAAYDAWHGAADRDASAVAMAWFDWAEARDLADEAAEAAWRWVGLAVRDVRRGLTLAGRQEVAVHADGLAENAGYWLVRAGRPAEACVAVEYARALTATGPSRWLDPVVEDMLSAAGHRAAWERFRRAAADLDALQRRQYDPTAPAGPVPEAELVTEEQLAWARLDRSAREVEEALGRRGLPGVEDLRARLRPQEVAVYVAAAERGGYALVLTATGPPQALLLPTAHADAVVESFDEADPIPAVLDALDDRVAGPLLAVLPPTNDLVLVPVGLLGVVPLHAALDRAAHRVGRPLVVRHAPNLRLAGVAGAIAARTDAKDAGAPDGGTVIVVEAGAVAGQRPLPATAAEADGVAAAYAAGSDRRPRRAVVLHAATLAEVRSILPTATTWHLACHGRVDTDDPLASSLVLHGGDLTLRELVGRDPNEHRLAVLSSCSTQRPAGGLLDEVMSLSTALLRTGVAGVVACLWEVEDGAAAALAVELHRRRACEASPPVALAAAVTWLRDATHAQLCEALPEVFHPPPGLPGWAVEEWAAQRPYAHPAHWAAYTYTGA